MPRKSLVSEAGNAATTMKPPLSETFRVDHFEEVTFVCGGTLERYWQQGPIKNNVAEFLVYKPTKLQIATQCDRCPRRHQPLNLACSRTKGVASPYILDTILYGPVSKFCFELLDEEVMARSKIRKVKVFLRQVKV